MTQSLIYKLGNSCFSQKLSPEIRSGTENDENRGQFRRTLFSRLIFDYMQRLSWATSLQIVVYKTASNPASN